MTPWPDFQEEKKKIEANIVLPFDDALARELGKATANRVIVLAKERHRAAQEISPLSGETPVTILAQRRIEIELVKFIHAILTQEAGLAKANYLVAQAVINDARAAGRQKASLVPGPTDLLTFAEILPQWSSGGALSLTVKESAPDRLRYVVTSCKYAEMYREMGLLDLGFLVSCGRDGAFMEGYAPQVSLDRAKTIMTGDDTCEFYYHSD
jgi:hypothetical protein